MARKKIVLGEGLIEQNQFVKDVRTLTFAWFRLPVYSKFKTSLRRDSGKGHSGSGGSLWRIRG